MELYTNTEFDSIMGSILRNFEADVFGPVEPKVVATCTSCGDDWAQPIIYLDCSYCTKGLCACCEQSRCSGCGGLLCKSCTIACESADWCAECVVDHVDELGTQGIHVEISSAVLAQLVQA